MNLTSTRWSSGLVVMGRKAITAGYYLDWDADLEAPPLYWVIARFDASGQLDATFGDGDGFTLTDFGAHSQYPFDLEASGTKVVGIGYAGRSTTAGAIARYST